MKNLIVKLIKKTCWYPRDSCFLSGKYFALALIRYWLFLETLIKRLPIHGALLKRDSNRGLNIVKFLGTAFSMKHLWWLLLNWPLDFLLGKDQLFPTCKILVFHSNLWNYRKIICLVLIEAVAQGCSIKKVFLEISQNSQENTCARVSF